jgi:hypothetical protein
MLGRPLSRYLHLNPLRAKVVTGLRALDRYPWSGHSALLEIVPRPWQDTRTILGQFGPTPRRAWTAYRAFVADGIPQGRRHDLQGGGLLRSLGGWAQVLAVRRQGRTAASDARILGSGKSRSTCWRRRPATRRRRCGYPGQSRT